jgi:hypothetical protein
MNDFTKDILEENLIFSIRQFQRYAKMSPVERNNVVINVLKDMLRESEKYQTELASWEKNNE